MSHESLEHEMNGARTRQRRLNFSGWTGPIFARFPAMLGGRCRLFVTGSAPVAQEYGEFLSLCFNCYVFEGFGMTETSASGAVQSVHTPNYGFIGEGIEGRLEAKLRSLPEMGYTVRDVR